MTLGVIAVLVIPGGGADARPVAGPAPGLGRRDAEQADVPPAQRQMARRYELCLTEEADDLVTAIDRLMCASRPACPGP